MIQTPLKKAYVSQQGGEHLRGSTSYIRIILDNRDDRRIVRVVISDLVFLGVVQEKSIKKLKLVFVRV